MPIRRRFATSGQGPAERLGCILASAAIITILHLKFPGTNPENPFGPCLDIAPWR